MTRRNSVNTFFLVNGFIFANWASRIPRIQEDYGLDNSLLGMILLAHSLGAFIAMPISGWLIVKNGSKSITVWSAVAFCSFFIVLPNSPGPAILVLPFFLMGAATGVMDVAMNAQAVVVESELKKPIMAFFHGLWSVGMVIGGLTGALFTRLEIPLNYHFLISGILSLLVLGIAQKYLHPDSRSKAPNSTSVLAWPKGPVVLLGLIAFCCMLGEGAMADWSGIYLRELLQSSELIATFGVIAFSGAMTVGRFTGDHYRTRWGSGRLMQSCAAVSLIGIVLVLIKYGIVLSLVGFGLVGLGLSVIVPIVYSMAGNLKGIAPGVGIAMSTTLGYAGFMIGPPVIGFISDATDLRWAMVFVGLLFAVMYILIFVSRNKLED